MNHAFDEILSADDDTRAGLFTTTALRLGTTPQNVEKDFWVCWTLDALFNGLNGGPRLLFKGGTSLSKGFGLISRFSEDIDVTVFRDDLGQGYSVEDLAALSRKKRDAALDAIREVCEAYINGELLEQVSRLAGETAERTGLPRDALEVTPDPGDRQTLLVRYPSATPSDRYIDKFVRIESGAKSALDPNSVRTISPYVGEDVPDLDLAVAKVTIVDPDRTFWDKVVILHGLRRWFEIRGELRGGGTASRATIMTFTRSCGRMSEERLSRTSRWARTALRMPACSSIARISTSRPPVHRASCSLRKERCTTIYDGTMRP